MDIELVAERTMTVGEPQTVEGPSPSQPFGVVFEDDGETGYLYGLDMNQPENPIVDALHVYNVADVTDRDKALVVQIVWSRDGFKAALLINQTPQAVFDFEARRGYCRTGFPQANIKWTEHDHAWSDDVRELFE